MNVSQTSGASSAWMLQRLFQSTGEASSSAATEGAGRQKMPGADGRTCNSSGGAAPAMSGQTMSGMISLQTQPQGASDIASDIVSGLDTDGDGEVSADEIAAAFSEAGIETDGVDSTLALLDADSSGTLSASEIATGIEADMSTHGQKGPPPGGPPPGGPPPSAEDTASGIVSTFDTDGDDSLGLDEILAALEEESDEDGSIASTFDSLDTDSDGQLSATELTVALQAQMEAGYRAYAEQAALAA